MITSRHITFLILCLTILHYIFEPRHARMKGLLYWKQLFDQRCQINALTVRKFPGLFFVNYLNKLYYQFNDVNVTACQAIDLSISGKPSAQLIAGMSHSYTGNSTTKYFKKSSLVNELLIESILVKDNLTYLSACVGLYHLWICLPLVFFIMYPFVHDSIVSCYRSIAGYLFDGESIHENITEPSNAPEESIATSSRLSADISIGSIHPDYINYAVYHWTVEGLLAEDIKASSPAKKRNEIYFEPSKSQRLWSDSKPTEPDLFTFSGHPSDSSGNDDSKNGFKSPTAPGNPGNQSNSWAQGNLVTAADQNPLKPSQKDVRPLDPSSPINSDFLGMSFVPPTGFVSEKLPEIAQNNTSDPTLDLPSVVVGPSNVTLGPTVSVPTADPSNPVPTVGPSKPTSPYKSPGASEPSKTAQPTGHFAAKKQSVNDFADQMGAYLKPNSSNTNNTKKQVSNIAAKPPDSRNGTPPPAEPSFSSTKVGSSLTEAVASAPFMRRRKTQPKTQPKAPTTVNLSFSRFKTGPDDSPTDPSNVASPSSVRKNQPSYTLGPSTTSKLPFSSSSDKKKKKDSLKSSRSSKPQLADSPGSLRSPSANTTSQIKCAPAFTPSFKHLKALSGTQIIFDASSRHNHGTPSGSIETSTTPVASQFNDTKTSTRPASLMANQSSSTTSQVSLEAKLTLNPSEEIFFTTALGTAQPLNLDEIFFAPALTTAQPLNPDPAPVAPSKNSRDNTITLLN